MPPKTATNEFVQGSNHCSNNFGKFIPSDINSLSSSLYLNLATFVVFFGRGDCFKENSITKSGVEGMPPDGVLCALCV